MFKEKKGKTSFDNDRKAVAYLIMDVVFFFSLNFSRKNNRHWTKFTEKERAIVILNFSNGNSVIFVFVAKIEL